MGLMGFLDNFFKYGNTYLFQFFVAFFDEFEHEIMNAASNPEANQLIRFESAPGHRLQKVVEASLGQQYVDAVNSLDLFRARKGAFEENLSKRLQSANEGMWTK